MTIRLAIVEDHPALADGLAALLRGSPDVEVVGTAPDVTEATALLERESPDIVLCDIRLAQGDDGFDLVRRFAPDPAFIMLTVASRPSYHARAVDLGARGYLSRMASVDEILDAIRTVAAGGSAYPSDARARPRTRCASRPSASSRSSRSSPRAIRTSRSPAGCRSG